MSSRHGVSAPYSNCYSLTCTHLVVGVAARIRQQHRVRVLQRRPLLRRLRLWRCVIRRRRQPQVRHAAHQVRHRLRILWRRRDLQCTNELPGQVNDVRKNWYQVPCAAGSHRPGTLCTRSVTIVWFQASLQSVMAICAGSPGCGSPPRKTHLGRCKHREMQAVLYDISVL